MITIKQGDVYAVTFTVNYDLNGSAAQLYASRGDGSTIGLNTTITDAANGVVQHMLDGTLDLGTYFVELEVTQDNERFTFPTVGFEKMVIVENIDGN